MCKCRGSSTENTPPSCLCCCGAAMAEAAIGGIILLLIVMAIIQFAYISFRIAQLQRALVETAHSTARQSNSCDTFAAVRLSQELGGNFDAYGVSQLTGSTVVVSSTTGELRRLELSVTTAIPCVFCRLLFGGESGSMPVSLAASAVVEQTGSCSAFSLDF